MKTSTQPTDKPESLRKIAILVASLDESLAARLVDDLPPREAAAVRRIVAQLDDIDPTEYRAAVDAFRQGLVEPSGYRRESAPPQLDGVELDESLLARIAVGEASQPADAPENHQGPWHELSDTDAAPLIEMLSAEQPQTIAVVLSRLETARAAELISKLSPALQAEVLTRLADLDPADEQSLQVVESQLAGWIHQQRQRRQRMAAGRELVQRILQSTPTHQRTAILAQLSRRNPDLAATLSSRSNPTPSPAAQPQFTQPVPQASSPVLKSHRPTPSLPAATSVITSVTTSATTLATRPKPPLKSDDLSSEPLSELEALDDQSLLRALRMADRPTVLLALAGASETLMKRIVQGLPRRRANQFRQQVRAIGPARLSDILAAQRELVRCGLCETTPSQHPTK